jgi:hypothetical protein
VPQPILCLTAQGAAFKIRLYFKRKPKGEYYGKNQEEFRIRLYAYADGGRQGGLHGVHEDGGPVFRKRI